MSLSQVSLPDRPLRPLTWKASVGALALAWLFVAGGARSQGLIYKCLDSGGGVVYQQILCPRGKALGAIERDPTPIDSAALERVREERRRLDAAYELAELRLRMDREVGADEALRDRPETMSDDTVATDSAQYWQASLGRPRPVRPHHRHEVASGASVRSTLKIGVVHPPRFGR